VVQDASRNGVGVVAEGGSGGGGGRFSGSEATVDISQSQGNAALVSIDHIVEGGLGAAWRGGRPDVIWEVEFGRG
jgi:hypothetical protein